MKCAAVVLAGLLSACATAPLPEVVTSRLLNANSAEFDGEHVSVHGMLVLGTNGRSIYQSEDRFNQWVREFESGKVDFGAYTDDCLTLAGSGALVLLVNQHLLHKRTVTLGGVFAANHYPEDALDLQKCANRSALLVDLASAQAIVRSAGGNVE